MTVADVAAIVARVQAVVLIPAVRPSGDTYIAGFYDAKAATIAAIQSMPGQTA
jgi:hypothetical protein